MVDSSCLTSRGFKKVKPGVWAKPEKKADAETEPNQERRGDAGTGRRGEESVVGAGGESKPRAKRVCAPKLECGDAPKRKGKAQDHREGSARYVVRIVSFRSRTIDDDNLCEKGVVDSLRYAGLLPDDNHGQARIITWQVQCPKGQERTEVTLRRRD